MSNKIVRTDLPTAMKLYEKLSEKDRLNRIIVQLTQELNQLDEEISKDSNELMEVLAPQYDLHKELDVTIVTGMSFDKIFELRHLSEQNDISWMATLPQVINDDLHRQRDNPRQEVFSSKED